MLITDNKQVANYSLQGFQAEKPVMDSQSLNSLRTKLDEANICFAPRGASSVDEKAGEMADGPRCILSKTFNNDGTVSIKYKNGVKETLNSQTGEGSVVLPNGIKLNISTGPDGLPCAVDAELNGKKIDVEVKDYLGTEIHLNNVDQKGSTIILKNSTGMRNKDLTNEEIDKMPKTSWARMNCLYEDPTGKETSYNQEITPDGSINITGGGLASRGKYLVDESLNSGDKCVKEVYYGGKSSYNVTENKGQPYEYTPERRYYSNERQADGTFKRVLVKTVQVPKEKNTVPTGCYDARWVEVKKDVWEDGKKYETETDSQASVPSFITKEQMMGSTK